jgi:predicted enzyme related to lactoylglutathione lyase
MSEDVPCITAVGQIAITITDIARATAFYRDVLGLTLLFEVPGMAFFECGGVRLFLSRAERPEFAATSILYYRVDDVTVAAQALESRGVTFLEAPAVVHRDARHELWVAFFQDSEGNHLALMAEVPLPPA